MQKQLSKRSPGSHVPAGRRVRDAVTSCHDPSVWLCTLCCHLISWFLHSYPPSKEVAAFLNVFLTILKMVLLSKAVSLIFSSQQVLCRPGCRAAASTPGPAQVPIPGLGRPRALGTFDKHIHASDSWCAPWKSQVFQITNEHCNH